MSSRGASAIRCTSDYLYVLTVADVRGTNPKLWNAWKARLFEEFYERTKRALRRGLETPVDQEELIRETQDQARAKILPRSAPEAVSRSGRSGPRRTSCATRPRRSPGTPDCSPSATPTMTRRWSPFGN